MIRALLIAGAMLLPGVALAQTNEESSKIIGYGVIGYGTGAAATSSKIIGYGVIGYGPGNAIVSSKVVTYAVLASPPTGVTFFGMMK